MVVRLLRRFAFPAALLLLTGSACYESPFPLDPAPQAVALDPALLGRWRCLPPDPEPDSKPANIVIARAREGVYAVEFKEDGEEAENYEAHASVLRGMTLFNIRMLGKSSDKPWSFGRYVFLRSGVLHVQLVSDDALKKVPKAPAAVRQAIERQQNDPALFVDACTCVRIKSGR